MTGRKEIKEGYMWASVQVHVHVNMLMRCTLILHTLGGTRTCDLQRTKLKVAGSSPAEVHFFSYPEKCCFIFRQTRPGWVWLPWT